MPMPLDGPLSTIQAVGSDSQLTRRLCAASATSCSAPSSSGLAANARPPRRCRSRWNSLCRTACLHETSKRKQIYGSYPHNMLEALQVH